MKYKLLAILAVTLLAGPMAAQAAIKIGTAMVQNGVAYVTGNGAVKGAQITWVGSAVTTANSKNGGFAFYGVLPANCTGRLSDGSSTIQVTILYCTPSTFAPVAKTGQYRDDGGGGVVAGSDADLKKGVPWPDPRFTDNGNGTITDNLTGLIWLRNANCPAISPKNWWDALTAVSTLADAACGLTDNSTAGDWRLPNVRELQSLVDYGTAGPALPSGHPFTNVVSGYWSQGYWSSTSSTDHLNAYALRVWLYGGWVHPGDYKDVDSYVIAVRGGS